MPACRSFRICCTDLYGTWGTLGGKTRDGRDATNDTSYLILDSARDFPLSYAELAVRMHARTPDRFLHAVCEAIKEGKGIPKLLNDEQIIPLFLSRGASIEEANDYAGSGCVEARLINRETAITGNAGLRLADRGGAAQRPHQALRRCEVRPRDRRSARLRRLRGVLGGVRGAAGERRAPGHSPAGSCEPDEAELLRRAAGVDAARPLHGAGTRPAHPGAGRPDSAALPGIGGLRDRGELAGCGEETGL